MSLLIFTILIIRCLQPSLYLGFSHIFLSNRLYPLRLSVSFNIYEGGLKSFRPSLLFTLLVCCPDAHGAMGCDQKSFIIIRIVSHNVQMFSYHLHRTWQVTLFFVCISLHDICHNHFFHTVCTCMIRLVRGSCLDCRCGGGSHAQLYHTHSVAVTPAPV